MRYDTVNNVWIDETGQQVRQWYRVLPREQLKYCDCVAIHYHSNGEVSVICELTGEAEKQRDIAHDLLKLISHLPQHKGG